MVEIAAMFLHYV